MALVGVRFLELHEWIRLAYLFSVWNFSRLILLWLVCLVFLCLWSIIEDHSNRVDSYHSWVLCLNYCALCFWARFQVPKSVISILLVYHIERWSVQILPSIVYEERIHAGLSHARLYQDILFLVINFGCSVKEVTEYLTKAPNLVDWASFGFLLDDGLLPSEGWSPPNAKHALSEGLLSIDLPLLSICIFFVLECCLSVEDIRFCGLATDKSSASA